MATPVLSALHVAFEEHSYCAEHGLEEGSESAVAAHAVSDIKLPAGVRAGENHEPAPGHELCAFGEIASRDAISAELTLAVEAAPLADMRAGLPVESIAGHPIPLLLVAPKSSPPLAA